MLKRMSSAAGALAIFAVATFSGCSKRESPQLAELPPPTSPSPPSPMRPVENDQAQGELAVIGAIQTVQGWTLPITNGVFGEGGFSLGPGDPAIENVAAILKRRPRLRVLVEAHVERANSSNQTHNISTMHAEAVLRALTGKGVNVAQIQIRGQTSAFTQIPENPGIVLIFSDSEGAFAPAALAP